VGVNFVDLIGHTPETTITGTTPFQRQPIPFTNEEDPGVYIRRNGDDDNGNMIPDWSLSETSVANEDDLINVTLDTAFAAPAGIRFELEKSTGDIRIWNSSSKGTEFAPVAGQASAITLGNGVPASVWVEWVTPGTAPGQASLDFRLVDNVSGNTVFTDRLVFHPFMSVVIAIGGFTQTPGDPAEAGSGTFQTAIDLYRDGYDVHMYAETEVQADGSGAAYNEVVSAIENRGVRHVAIIGFSWGGGATFQLANGLDANRPFIFGGPFTIDFTAYVDAVKHVTGFPPLPPETRRPPSSRWHLNIYEPNSAEGGGPMPNTSLDGGANEDDNTEVTAGFTSGLTHTTIDDDPTVRGRVKTLLKLQLPTP
jgi:hypothetical protein